MSPDFLPLEVGNRWVYEVQNEDGRKIGDIDFAVQEHTIVSGRSFYVLTRFPFTAADGGRTKLVRYDRQERQYVKMADGEEGPLFLSGGAKTEVLQSDSSGLPVKFVLAMDLITLTFQRGLGIVEARMETPDGVQIAKVTNARVGERRLTEEAKDAVAAVPEPRTPEQKTKQSAENVTSISDENPVLDVQTSAVTGGHRFVLTVINTSDKLLPVHFRSSQSYDFVVRDVSTGQEVWRWSRRMFFTQVLRQESIRPNGNWKFEVTWNHRDNDLNPVAHGRYQVAGIVPTEPVLESEPVIFEIN